MTTINLRQWSTPAVIGAGLFVTVSGVLMFLGVRQPIQEAHEWIGLLFVAAIVLHLAHHWRGFTRYFSQPLALGIVGAVALATSALILVSANEEGGHGMHKVMHRIEAAPLAEVAPLLDQSPDQMVARVQAAGYSIADAGQSIADIAAANGKEPRALMSLLLD